MRLMDVLLAFPAILLAIFITAILGPESHQYDDRGRHCLYSHYARIVRSENYCF